MFEESPHSNKRDLVSIDVLSNARIEELLSFADEISQNLRAWSALCPGLILASLFYEPSTRTRLSFESAMLRLGGGTIGIADPRSSSASKGESLADTVRIIGGSYADVIVLRHPSEGAARHAADYAPVPVINAGDGSHEHPTQTLCDLYVLRRSKKKLKGLNVVFCGDLKFSRTVHSLAYALARFGAHLFSAPQTGLEMPESILRRLKEEFGNEPTKLASFPPKDLKDFPKIDAIYLTRPQRERFQEKEKKEEAAYLRLERKLFTSDAFAEAILMHPLPRTEELPPEWDQDPRSLYFQQASFGVPVRMAILAYCLGRKEFGKELPLPKNGELYRSELGLRCSNSNCISRAETRYTQSCFRLFFQKTFSMRCEYCEMESNPSFWGLQSNRLAWPISAKPIPPTFDADLVLFNNIEELRAQDFDLSPSH